MFNKAFVDLFFPREKREAKVVEFINLHHGGMSELEYSLNFTQLLKYAPFFVFNPRGEIICFLMGVSDELQKECHSVMLHDNMNISRLMVNAQQVEEGRDKRKILDAKRERYFDGGCSKGRLEIEEKPTFKRWFLIKFFPSSVWLGMIGCLTLSLKRKGILGHQPRRQIV